MVTQVVEYILEPQQPNQRPPKPEITAPSNGNNKITKYTTFLFF